LAGLMGCERLLLIGQAVSYAAHGATACYGIRDHPQPQLEYLSMNEPGVCVCVCVCWGGGGGIAQLRHCREL